MKIVHINKFHHVVGGLEVHFFALTKLLEHDGHTVIPFSMHHEKNIDSVYSKYFVSKVDTSKVSFNWNGIKTALRMLWSLEASRKLQKLINAEQPDVAIVHGIYHQLSPSVLYTLKKNNIPVVMVLHDFKLVTPVYNLYCPRCALHNANVFNINSVLKHRSVKNSYLATGLCILEHWLHRKINVYEKNVDLFIAPAEAMAGIIRTHMPLANVKVLPNFININIDNSVELDQSHTQTVLLFGRVENIKGVWTLIKAQKYLPEHIDIRIVGDGSELSTVEKYIQKHRIKNITCVGYCSGDVLKKEISKSAVIVVPSICFDIQPFSIMEAFMYGKPVVATRIGGIPELVDHGKNGFLFEPENEKELAKNILHLLSNKNLCKEMGANGRKKVTLKYTPEYYLEQLLNHINEII